MNAYSAPDIDVNALPHLIKPLKQLRRQILCPHFVEEETEAGRPQPTCLGTHC